MAGFLLCADGEDSAGRHPVIMASLFLRLMSVLTTQCIVLVHLVIQKCMGWSSESYITSLRLEEQMKILRKLRRGSEVEEVR